MNILSSSPTEEATALPQEVAGPESVSASQATPNPASETPQVGQTPEAVSPGTVAQETPGIQESPAPNPLQMQFDQAQRQLADAQEQLKVFEELRANADFQKWYQSQQQPQPSALPERDAHIEELSDPARYAARFQAELKRSLDAYHQEHVAPIIQQYEMQAQRQAKVNEIHAFAADHEDFWDLADKGGPIDQIMMKYPNISAEDAYNLARSRTAQADALKKAHEVVNMKKQAVSEKPGASSADRQGQVTVHSDEEAMSIAMGYAKKGQRPPKFIFAESKK